MMDKEKYLHQRKIGGATPSFLVDESAETRDKFDESDCLNLKDKLPVHFSVYGDGVTLLHIAILKGDLEAVKMLLNAGANPWIKNAEGLNAFNHAVNNEQVKGILLSINALHLAASTGDEITLSTLLKSGVLFNARNQEGKTALHLAIEGRHLKLANILRNVGADSWIQDSAGITAACYIHSPELRKSWREIGKNITDSNPLQPYILARAEHKNRGENETFSPRSPLPTYRTVDREQAPSSPSCTHKDLLAQQQPGYQTTSDSSRQGARQPTVLAPQQAPSLSALARAAAARRITPINLQQTRPIAIHQRFASPEAIEATRLTELLAGRSFRPACP